MRHRSSVVETNIEDGLSLLEAKFGRKARACAISFRRHRAGFAKSVRIKRTRLRNKTNRKGKFPFPPTECELKFLVSLKSLKRFISLNRLRPHKVVQSYFPK